MYLLILSSYPFFKWDINIEEFDIEQNTEFSLAACSKWTLKSLDLSELNRNGSYAILNVISDQLQEWWNGLIIFTM